MRVILASTSPRRLELLKTLNIPFEVKSMHIEEKIDENKNHYEECKRLAYDKAKAVFDNTSDDVIVIGSDTIVSMNKKIYGKPKDYQDAFHMLKEFSNKEHEVISSLCLLIRKNNHIYQELTYDKCKVFVSEMDDKEINDWIMNNDVYTKAGAYAIQEGFGKFIKKVEGDYFSIVGFPLNKVYHLLKKYYQ